MRFKIEYEFDGEHAPHFFAKSTIGGKSILSAGKSWAEAREHLLDKLTVFKTIPEAPESEEVNI